MPHLADRADIIKWADRIDARHEFPRLFRGLIRANNDQVIDLQMRAAEGIGAPGYDGISDALQPTPFVPAGLAVWELSVGGDPADKAQSNYRLRTVNSPGFCGDTILLRRLVHTRRNRYSPETRERAVRMVVEHRDEYRSE